MCIFTGEEWWWLKVHVVDLETLDTRLEGFFKADLLRICTMALLFYYDHNPFRIFLSCFFFFNFGNPSEIKSPDLYKKAKP